MITYLIYFFHNYTRYIYIYLSRLQACILRVLYVLYEYSIYYNYQTTLTPAIGTDYAITMRFYATSFLYFLYTRTRIGNCFLN